jgi:hypothetical protein
MEHAEMKTNSAEHLMDFVKSGIAKLDRFRIEIKRDRDGLLVAELVSTSAESQPV